jgi:hypothetical protein
MNNELRPCPFCGSEVELLSSHFEGRWCVHPPSILCSKCQQKYEGVGVSVSKGSEVEREEFADGLLVRWWNTRPAEDALQAEIAKLVTELNNINRLADMILERANFGSKATKAEMHERLTSIYVYASHIKRALARTDNAPDTNAGSAEESR